MIDPRSPSKALPEGLFLPFLGVNELPPDWQAALLDNCGRRDGREGSIDGTELARSALMPVHSSNRDSGELGDAEPSQVFGSSC